MNNATKKTKNLGARVPLITKESGGDFALWCIVFLLLTLIVALLIF